MVSSRIPGWAAILAILLLMPLAGLQAQIQRVLHQSVELSDSVQVIRIEADNPYVAESWPMSGILVESKVMLYNCRQNILDYLVEAGRYEMDLLTQGETLVVRPNSSRKEPIQVAGGGCSEVVEQIFYMPAGFFGDSLGVWTHADWSPPETILPPQDSVRDTLPLPNPNER